VQPAALLPVAATSPAVTPAALLAMAVKATVTVSATPTPSATRIRTPHVQAAPSPPATQPDLILERAANSSRDAARTPRYPVGSAVERLSSVGDHSFSRATPRYSATGLGDSASGFRDSTISRPSQGYSTGNAPLQGSGSSTRDSALLHGTPRYSAAAAKHAYAPARSVTVNYNGSMTPRPASARATLQQAGWGAGALRESGLFGAPAAVHPEPGPAHPTDELPTISPRSDMAPEAKPHAEPLPPRASFHESAEDPGGLGQAEPLFRKTRGGVFSSAVGRSTHTDPSAASPATLPPAPPPCPGQGQPTGAAPGGRLWRSCLAPSGRLQSPTPTQPPRCLTNPLIAASTRGMGRDKG